MPRFAIYCTIHCTIHCTTVLALVLLLSLAMPINANPEKDKREALEQLQRDMAELQNLLKNFKTERSKLENSLKNSEVEIGDIQKKIRGIQQQLETQQQELQQLQQQREQLNGAQRSQQQQISQQVRAAYQLGRQKKLKVLLNQEQPDKINRALTYYDYFNRARLQQIEAYIDIISQIDRIEPEIVSKAQTLEQARNELHRQRQQLLSQKDQRSTYLTQLNATIHSKDKQLKKLTQDRAELERLVAAVEQTISNIQIPQNYQAFRTLKGKLPWPVAGRRQNSFGSQRAGGKLHWQGINIAAAEGTAVKAIHHGRIVFADWFRGSGLLVILDHGEGYMSLYAHNQSLLVEAGEWVGSGDTIATVGNSGGLQQAALYFEIRHRGDPADPTRWCRG